MLTKRAVIAVKLEGTEGTAETLAAADADVLAFEPSFAPTITMYERSELTDSLSPFAQVAGSKMATITFSVNLRGSGAAGTAPKIGKLLKACGFGETVVVSTSVTYAPISVSIPTLTMALYRDGLMKQIRGARGTVTYSGKVGEPGVLNFSFQGVYVGVTDTAILTGTGIEATNLPVLLSAAFTIASFAAKISSISIDMGNKLAMRNDVNKAEGFFSCIYAGRSPKGNFDPEEGAVSAHDWYGRFKAGTSGALTFQHNGGAGNICTISAPVVQYTGVTETSRDDIAALGVDFALSRSAAAGNDEISVAFT